MPESYFRFYASLNDFLPRKHRFVRFPYKYQEHQTIKHIIESIGVPHPEVDLILINGEPASFEKMVPDHSHVSVYPHFSSLDISSLNGNENRGKISGFICDGHLGKLATYLRLLGIDVWYENNAPDELLAEIAHRTGKVLITRDRGLLKRNIVREGYCVREKEPAMQLAEILNLYHHRLEIHPFSRCPRCNTILKDIEKEKIIDRLELKTKLYYNHFKICSHCNKIYWRGSHYEHMLELLNFVKEKLGKNSEEIFQDVL